jgi:hypothetical protein
VHTPPSLPLPAIHKDGKYALKVGVSQNSCLSITLRYLFRECCTKHPSNPNNPFPTPTKNNNNKIKLWVFVSAVRLIESVSWICGRVQQTLHLISFMHKGSPFGVTQNHPWNTQILQHFCTAIPWFPITTGMKSSIKTKPS